MFHTTTTHCIEFRAFSHCIEFRDGERWATTTSTMIGPAEGAGHNHYRPAKWEPAICYGYRQVEFKGGSL